MKQSMLRAPIKGSREVNKTTTTERNLVELFPRKCMVTSVIEDRLLLSSETSELWAG